MGTRSLFGWGLFGVCSFLSGCTSLFHPNTVCRQEEAVSAHLAVLSVAPWNSYRDAVQPAFKLSADDALGLAVPNTMDLEQKTIDALGVTAKVALPGTTMTQTKSIHSETGKQTTETQDLSQTNSSGDVSKLTFNSSPAGGRTATALPPATSVLGTAIGTDPMLKYQAAEALYQEVQMMNRYIKDAAVTDGYLPYVVRLSVGIMPRRRNLSYDAYTLISFFHGPWREEDINDSTNKVLVLPVLVTDDLESMIESKSVDQISQLALALSAVVHGVGASGDIQKINENLRTVLGHNLNSTFMVTRVSDNTIQCRFGAAYQSGAKLAMTPQTHNVSLLVLIPKDQAASPEITNRTVRLVANTSLVDPRDGTSPKAQTRDEGTKQLSKLLKDLGVGNNIPATKQAALRAEMAGNDFAGFKTNLLTIHPHFPYPEAVWVNVTSIRNSHPISSATLTMPRQDPYFLKDKFEIANDVPVLLDDGKKTTVALIAAKGGIDLSASQLSAFLAISPKKPNVGKLTLTATSVALAAGGSEVDINFPSISPFKLCNTNGVLDADAKVTLYSIGREGINLLNGKDCNYFVSPDTTKAGFGVAVRSRFIMSDSANGGTCQVLFTDKKPDARIRFTIDGADVNTAEAVGQGVTVQPDADGWIVSTNGMVKVTFSNLSAFSPVTITATDASNKAPVPQIVLSVIQQSTPKRRVPGQ
jgi:hypothetical protein